MSSREVSVWDEGDYYGGEILVQCCGPLYFTEYLLAVLGEIGRCELPRLCAIRARQPSSIRPNASGRTCNPTSSGREESGGTSGPLSI